MRIHFVAIGGSAMHNLAIALQNKGYTISGSDDEIFEPSRSRLALRGLLPSGMGWFPERLEERPDAVILGMHARSDNPELQRAKELGIKIYSYPEFLYEHAREKTRVVIGGSHGKTTITAIILHVLRHCRIDADYMVGAQLRGFEVMVKLSDESPVMVLEGDEYLTSAIDPRPKFHIYRPHLALISGISWDHINVFPTWEGYISEFEKFIDLIEPGGCLVYCLEDKEVLKVVRKAGNKLRKIAYGLPRYEIKNGITCIMNGPDAIPLQVFGRHNLMNIEGAREICRELGVKDKEFYASISSFPGADNRLELLAGNDVTAIFRDFAHSPSKLRATVEAVKEQFPGRELTACMELHTFSSLSGHFLDHYKGTLDSADIPIVYFNPHAIGLKRLPAISEEQVMHAFDNNKLKVFTDSGKLREELAVMEWTNRNLLLMSSGNFNNIPLTDIIQEITGNDCQF
jgi:UDP-N-acetylmuramate: L-alanyl-gamma-D-glutamyl-meso-diaminopimelate ligase